MSVSDFKVGDRVKRANRQNSFVEFGVVEANDGKLLTVAFDDSRCRGVYDDLWFEISGASLIKYPPSK